MSESGVLGIIYPITVLAGTAVTIYLTRKCREWSSKDYQYEDSLENLNIMQVTSEEQCKTACLQMNSCLDGIKVLGFDCEWVSFDGQQNTVALLQLADPTGQCFLFRLNQIRKIPDELKEILQDSRILKVGVCPEDDAKKLLRDFGVQVQGCLDLRHLYSAGGGLASLALQVLNITMDKNWRIRCSNWEAEELTKAQLDYAAKDALIAVKIFNQWLIKESTTLWGIWKKKRNACDFYIRFNPYLDIRFNVKSIGKNQQLKPSDIKKEFEDTGLPQCKKKTKNAIAARKSPLYHNCFMYAPDGELLCSCDTRKAEWYVMKGLAEVVPGEPFSIRLKFEPSGRAGTTSEGRFYTQLKQNRCVVCGAGDSCLRHNVVPREYRRHFPAVMKNHQSHDIVLTCVTCHHISNLHDLNLRNKLAVMCDAPLDQVPKYIENKNASDAIKAAKALLRQEPIPLAQIAKLEEVVLKYHGVNQLNQQILENTAKMSKNEENPNYTVHGTKVVSWFAQSEGGLLQLEKTWREHFLETMKPRFLPALWSVSHNHERLTKRAAEKRVQLDDLRLAGLLGKSEE